MQATEGKNARDAHLFGPGPKRILALDGGGVRGALSIAFLERIEAVLGEIEGKPVRLCDWFDLIGGTSTGAIIAVALALGFRASDIRRFYEELGPRVFQRPFYRIMGLQPKFDAGLLKRELERILGARTLDSEDLLTGFGVILKRMDTGSTWIILNNSRSKFWNTPTDNSFIGNRYMRLLNLVRASTAAPGYFDPELISIIEGDKPGMFLDGGLTPHNNPSLMLLMAAVLPPFGLNWPVGPENLMLASVGTGTYRPRLSHGDARRLRAIGLAIQSLAALIDENQRLALTLLTWLGETPHRWVINSEIGDLSGIVPPGGPLFRFLRYDVALEETWLADALGEKITLPELKRLRRMDEPSNIPRLYHLGQKAASVQVQRSDFERPIAGASRRPQ